MKVISGEYKGRNLKFSKDKRQRPTQSRVKEAVFNILQDNIENLVVLDLCCGTGGLGIEALSRGASHCTFVDTYTDTVRENLNLIFSAFKHQRFTVLKQDCIKFLKKEDQAFDIIFFDPPWTKETLFPLALKQISDFDILKATGILVLEHPKSLDNSCFSEFQIKDQRHYGDTVITLLTIKDT